jgi:hypothetical protein
MSNPITLATSTVFAIVWLVACTGTELGTPPDHPASASAPAAKVASAGALRSDFDPAAESGATSAPPEHSGHDHAAPAPEAGHDHAAPAADDKAPAQVTFTCPMHPEIERAEPGTCPKCGMKLVPKKDKK